MIEDTGQEEGPSATDPDVALIAAEAAKAAALAEARLIETRAEMAAMRKTIRSEFDDALSEARRRNAELEEDARSLKAAAAAAETAEKRARRASEAAGAKAERRIAALERDVLRLKADAANAESEALAIRQSTIWRLTAPLRVAIDRLRGR